MVTNMGDVQGAYEAGEERGARCPPWHEAESPLWAGPRAQGGSGRASGCGGLASRPQGPPLVWVPQGEGGARLAGACSEGEGAPPRPQAGFRDDHEPGLRIPSYSSSQRKSIQRNW